MVSSWKSPRPLGPSVRAVITLVPIPIAMTAICAAKMPKESRANWPCLGMTPPSGRGQRRRPHLGPERVEGVAALAHEGWIALLDDEAAPQARDRRLERVATRLEAGQVDRHVGHAETVRRRGHRRGCREPPVVEQALLQVAPQHERTLDVVRMRDLLQHEHEPRD